MTYFFVAILSAEHAAGGGLEILIVIGQEVGQSRAAAGGFGGILSVSIERRGRTAGVSQAQKPADGNPEMNRTYAIGLAALAVAATLSAKPSSTATIRGRVLDALGQPIPGASVSALPVQSGPIKEAVSDRQGAFEFVDLPRATYRIDAALMGFETARRNNVEADGVTQIDLTLTIGAICECITGWSGRLRIRWPSCVNAMVW